MFAFLFVAFTNAMGTVHAGPSALIVLFRTAFNFDYKCLRRKTGTYYRSFFVLIDRPVFSLSFGLQNCKHIKGVEWEQSWRSCESAPPICADIREL